MKDNPTRRSLPVLSNAIREGEEIFHRMTVKERGHFANTLRLFPVTAIAMSNNYITFTRARRSHTYRWSDIITAEILSKESHKGYGRAASGLFLKRTVRMSCTDGECYSFDISEDFPDFECSIRLVELLNRRLTFESTVSSSSTYFVWIVAAILTILVGIVLKMIGF